jgi:N-methylhydantoinase A
VGRGDLEGGRPGPLIVEEYDATCLVPPQAMAALDARGNIVIDLAASPAGASAAGR